MNLHLPVTLQRSIWLMYFLAFFYPQKQQPRAGF
jgi:hypothetical protein